MPKVEIQASYDFLCDMFFGMYAIGTHLSFMFHSLAQYSEGFLQQTGKSDTGGILAAVEISQFERKKSRSLRFSMANHAFPCKYQPKMVNFPGMPCWITQGIYLNDIFHFIGGLCNNGAKQNLWQNLHLEMHLRPQISSVSMQVLANHPSLPHYISIKRFPFHLSSLLIA